MWYAVAGLELQDDDAVEVLTFTCRERVAEFAYLEIYADDYDPRPHPRHGRRLAGPPDRITRGGLDVRGRPTIAESIYDGDRVGSRELIAWTEARVEIVRRQNRRVGMLSVLDFDVSGACPDTRSRPGCVGAVGSGQLVDPAL